MPLNGAKGLGGEEQHLCLLETVALLDLFKERSGLAPSVDALSTTLPELNPEAVKDALGPTAGMVSDHLPEVQ